MKAAHLAVVARKELRHVWRDGQTLMIILSLPLVMMFLFGYALKSEIEDARVVVIDPAPSDASRALVASLEASRQFSVAAVVSSGVAEELVEVHRARGVLQLPVDLADPRGEAPRAFGVLLDGSDPATATTLRAALPAFLRSHLSEREGTPRVELVELSTRHLFNPDQESALFFVPGLMATLLAMIGTLLTSVAIVREKELGTMTNLRLSDLGAAEIVVGKLAPYFLIAASTGVFILLVGRVAFGVQVVGSLALLAACTSLYLVVALAMGLLVSTLVSRQQHAMLAALGITMMPTILLSGFVFARSSLPPPLWGLSCAVPATWYLQIVRGIILKGSHARELLVPVGALAAQAVVLLSLASFRFSKDH